MREIKHLSVHQWLRSAIPDSQQPSSPIGFLFLKLPPPPCAVLLLESQLLKHKLVGFRQGMQIQCLPVVSTSCISCITCGLFLRSHLLLSRFSPQKLILANCNSNPPCQWRELPRARDSSHRSTLRSTGRRRRRVGSNWIWTNYEELQITPFLGFYIIGYINITIYRIYSHKYGISIGYHHLLLQLITISTPIYIYICHQLLVL